MSKVLVEVHVPAAGRRVDVWIPYESALHETLDHVKMLFADDPDSPYVPSQDAVLCDRETGSIFNVNLTAEELGLSNGSKLMLV